MVVCFYKLERKKTHEGVLLQSITWVTRQICVILPQVVTQSHIRVALSMVRVTPAGVATVETAAFLDPCVVGGRGSSDDDDVIPNTDLKLMTMDDTYDHLFSLGA